MPRYEEFATIEEAQLTALRCGTGVVLRNCNNIIFNHLIIGALNTNRTCDLPLRRGLLYPLSYQGVDGILR